MDIQRRWLQLCLLLVLVLFVHNKVFADNETSKMFGIGTDVATLLVFHPDSLSHHDDHPIAWYSAPFAVKRDLAEGRLIGFMTGSDGGYRVRMTTVGMTQREEKYKRCAVDFRLHVEHGWVAIDNSDGLPGEAQMDELANRPEQHFKLQNGFYRVTVAGIDWHKEPGSLDSNGRSTEKSLPSYVVHFQSVDELSEIKVQPCLPDLRDKEPNYFDAKIDNTFGPLEQFVFDQEKSYPLLLTDSVLKFSQRQLSLTLNQNLSERLKFLSVGSKGLAGLKEPEKLDPALSPEEQMAAWSARSRARTDWFYKLSDRRFVIANKAAEGSVANCCTVTSMGTDDKDRLKIGLTVLGTVRLTKVSDDGTGAVCQAAVLNTKPADDPDVLAALKEVFADYAKEKKIKAVDYYVGQLRQQKSLGPAIRIVLDHFETSPERFVEYAVQDERTQAQMLTKDLRAQLRK